MANLTTRLGFGFEHQEFAVSQNQGAAEELWNRLGLEGGLAASVEASVPQFGIPFLDLQPLVRSTLGVHTLLVEFIGLDVRFSDAIERAVEFASSRISRNLKRE